MKIISLASVTLLALALPLAAGCSAKSSDSDEENVSEGSEANETEGNAESLSASLLGGSSSGTVGLQSEDELSGSLVQAQDNVGAKAEAFFIPSGCLTVNDDIAKSTATYNFSSCSGPYGLVHINGTVTITYDVSSGSELHLKYSASNLQINGATIDWNATADVTVSGTAYDLKWQGSFSGTTKSGRAINRTNTKEYQWSSGVACLSVSGSSTGTVTGDSLTTDIINYSKCADACPASGSEIKITNNTSNRTYDLTYGTDTATYTGPSGGSVNFTPLCAL